jgi:NAD+ kinase
MNDLPIKKPFKQAVVLHHPNYPATQRVTREICKWLTDREVEARPGSSRDHRAKIEPQIENIDLIVVVGGDGSLLRAAHMAAGHDIPIVGVNMGRVGFLSEMNPDNWPDLMPRVLSGDYWLERRMMIKAETWHQGRLVDEQVALNDVVISRGSLARVIHLETEVDGDYLTNYVCDGLIVSTPTGSTAYALAVGGPILPPELRNILIIPVAPHLALDRAIILSEGSTVRICVGERHHAVLTVDGQFEVDLQDGDYVDVKTSEYVSHFIRLGKKTYFYETLLKRLEPKQVLRND